MHVKIVLFQFQKTLRNTTKAQALPYCFFKRFAVQMNKILEFVLCKNDKKKDIIILCKSAINPKPYKIYV
jgi:hypothetical protein